MVDKERLAGVFTAQLYDVRTKRDGGGRITLDFGKDGLEAVQYIQTIASKGECSFNVVMVVEPPIFNSDTSENHNQQTEDCEPF